MYLEPFLKEFFKTPEAKETCRILRTYGSNCSSVLEFGIRGGLTAIALMQALIDKPFTFRPRYVGIDLVQDESINRIVEIADKVGISFQFWKGHSSDFPPYEADCLLWDTFHCAGNLINDLNRISPHIHKYIIIVGTKIDGDSSEAIRRSLDLELVSKELRIPISEAAKGLNTAIDVFLQTDLSWKKGLVTGDITILERVTKSETWLFKE